MSAHPYVPGRHAIEAYGAGGFRFAGMSHVGSILATPSGVGALAAAALAEIDAAALAPLFAELDAAPGSIEFLVIGAGAKIAAPSVAVQARLRVAGLRFEAMATGAAARVYNILLDEKRRAAALLIAVP
jgi:uncharacterized protein